MRIFLDTIGCRLNQAEIEKFAVQFRAAGHTLVSSARDADLVVVNTCAVTMAAGSDSRQHIRQAARLGNAQIIATGCLATLDGEGLLALPRVTDSIPNVDKNELVAHVLKEAGILQPAQAVGREPIPGKRERTRAFIKAQDGCDNHCTFCITRLVRGRARSNSSEEILEDIKIAIDGGAQEAVLSGVQLGSWGRDLNPNKKLADLVHIILKETTIPRLRLSSVEPWDLDEEFFELWRDRRLCRQLHLPLQSGSAEILRKMGRKNTPGSYFALVEMARRVRPEIAITTDVLVGFPGETDEQFTETVKFIQEMQFAGGHVFSFSPRPGTGADLMENPIPKDVKKERSFQTRELFIELAKKYQRQFIGMNEPVLWEKCEQLSAGDFQVEGWTDTYIKVNARSECDLSNEISLVDLIELTDEGMKGKIVKDRL
jgi:threonylcarbamoyladenosine tRNA methylthiotransferase MtaB